MGRKKKKKTEKRGGKISSFIKRFIKSIIAIVLLSALILAIFLFVKYLSNVDSERFPSFMSKLFTSNEKKSKNGDDVDSGENDESTKSTIYSKKDATGNLLFKVCLISDIHEDKENLGKALEKVKNSGCINMVVIGDITNYGDVPTLKDIKDILNGAGIDYYAIPGDHDLAESVSVENFNSVFGRNYHLMQYSGFSFLIIDNSPNFTNMSIVQMMWFENNIDKANFIVMSQPLFTEGLNPPFNGIYMGSMATNPEDAGMKKMQMGVRASGKDLLDLIRKNKNIKAVFAGEHHRSSELVDPKRSDLTHYVVGAITGTVNDLPQEVIQTPRFSILSVYDSGDYLVEDILLD